MTCDFILHFELFYEDVSILYLVEKLQFTISRCVGSCGGIWSRILLGNHQMICLGRGNFGLAEIIILFSGETQINLFDASRNSVSEAVRLSASDDVVGVLKFEGAIVILFFGMKR